MSLSKATKGASHYSNLSDMGSFSPNIAFKGSHTTECGESQVIVIFF